MAYPVPAYMVFTPPLGKLVNLIFNLKILILSTTKKNSTSNFQQGWGGGWVSVEFRLGVYCPQLQSGTVGHNNFCENVLDWNDDRLNSKSKCHVLEFSTDLPSFRLLWAKSAKILGVYTGITKI